MARPSDRFYIGQLQGSGLQQDLQPFAIPDDAFFRLNNAYVFRGRVRKRFGARLMPTTSQPTVGYESLPSRLRINIGTTDGSGNLASTNLPGSGHAEGIMFSVGDQIYTCTAAGNPATMTNTGGGSITLDTTASPQTVSISGATATGASVFFYPAQPVMGLINYEASNINDEPVFAFDTQFAYRYTASGWTRLGTATWSGSNSDFFWGTNWQGVTSDTTYLFVTNYIAADGIKYYNGTNWTQNSAGTNINYTPIVNNTNRLLTGRIIVPFKDRLVVLNTKERAEGSNIGTTAATTGNFSYTVTGSVALGQSFVVNNTVFTIKSTAAGAQPMTVKTITGLSNPPTATFNFSTKALVITGNNNNPSTDVYFFDNSSGSTKTYVNRCRFSWNGSPVETAANEPNSVSAFLEAPGLGGYIDAPTKEAIITAQFLYDRLIVYFERSTWELVYTGNQLLPFVWQKINTELGAESTFSQVPFDKNVLGVGNVGIHACDGSNVSRIDKKIPDAVFEVHNTDNALKRVSGIRDYFPEMVYWTFPDETRNSTFPFCNKVLVYNYKTGSWAFNDDSITTFGYFQAPDGISNTWENLTETWQEADYTWRMPALNEKFRNVVAGNQQGYVFILQTGTTYGTGKSTNAPVLSITDMPSSPTLKVYNHNLSSGDYIKITDCQGITSLNDTIVQVDSVSDENTFTIDRPYSGTYDGGGMITRVSQADILTKDYNFYLNQARNNAINRVDFLFDKTSNGKLAVDYYSSTSSDSLVSDGGVTGALVGNGTLETSPYTTYKPEEANQRQLWHSYYPMVSGNYIQMRFYLNDKQMRDINIAESDFVLHAMILYVNPTGDLV